MSTILICENIEILDARGKQNGNNNNKSLLLVHKFKGENEGGRVLFFFFHRFWSFSLELSLDFFVDGTRKIS